MDIAGGLDSIGLGDISLKGVLDTILNYAIIFVLLIILGVVLIGLWYLSKRKKSKKDPYKIGWWEEINNTPGAKGMDIVEEITIPGTALKLFYKKDENRYLPRFTRAISPNVFYVLISPTRQLINFTLKGISSDLKGADLDYDHTDMLWAAENAREYVKRNYKDKSVKWWQLYQSTIAVAALIVLMTFSFLLIIYFMRGMMQDMSSVAGQFAAVSKTCGQVAATSGLVGA